VVQSGAVSQFEILCCSPAFLPADSHGGLPYSTFNLCRALIHAGARVTVVTTDRNGDRRLDVATDRWTSYEDVRVWYASTRSGPFVFAPSAKTAIAETMPSTDCVIGSGTLWVHLGWLAWRAARRHGKPRLEYPRGLLDLWAYRHKALRKQAYWHAVGKRILDEAAVVVALTEQERQRLRDLHVTNRIEVIPNGAASEMSAEPVGRDWLDARYPALRGRRYVLFLGRVHEKKGLDVLLPAVAALSARHDRVAFVIAGPIASSFEARWRALVAEHRLEDTLILPGPVSGTTKAAWLAHADLFVLPSYSEGMPMAALEALRAGCPVVLTKACALPEVEDAHAGLVIDPDVGQLVGALSALLDDAPRRQMMAQHARALAATNFNWDTIGERTLALCRSVAASACSSPRK